MMKYIKRLFFVNYRLTYYVSGHTKSIYGTRRRMVMARLGETRRVGLWTLYKTGPLFLPERPVNWGEGRSV